MARPKSIRAPTAASLPNGLCIPSATPSLVKSFGKLTRQALLDLVFHWLDDRNVQSFLPFLKKDDVDNGEADELSPYPAERTIDDVRNAYQDLQVRRGGKREVIDRILEGDWRHGISLRQLAMIDLRYIDDHPSGLRWSALELYRIGANDGPSPEASAEMTACIPRVHSSTFLNNLQQQISPLVKAHYYIARSNVLPVTFLRVFVTNSPYNHPRQAPEMLTDSSRVIYVAFPDSCPFIYTSIASSTSSKAGAPSTHTIATDPRTLQRIVRDSVPVALSAPHRRYSLKATSLTAKSLQALLALRGPGRSNRAAGAFSIFADAVVEGSPLDPRPPSTVSPEEYMGNGADRGKENRDQNGQGQDEELSGPQSSKRPRKLDPAPQIPKKRKLAIDSRFGTSGTLSSAPLDRFDVRLLDSPHANETVAADNNPADQSEPTVSLTFAGSDIISGIRKLTELGIVDPERMPSWMTGEEAVSVAVVRGGNRVLQDGG